MKVDDCRSDGKLERVDVKVLKYFLYLMLLLLLFLVMIVWLVKLLVMIKVKGVELFGFEV